MAVRILVQGDLHIKPSNLGEAKVAIDKFLAAVKKLKPDVVVLLGDTLDKHETAHLTALKMAVDYFRELSLECHVFVLIGNHDRASPTDFQSDLHPFVAVKQWDGITIVDRATEAEVKGQHLLLVPFVPNGRFAEAVASAVDAKQLAATTIVFAHQEFKGCRMGGMVSKDGDVWPADAPLVVSGHIHDAQTLGTNVVYTGTPSYLTYGDRGLKTVGLFEINTKADADAVSYKEMPLQLDVMDPKIRVKYFRINLGMRKKKTVAVTAEGLKSLKIANDEDVRIVLRGTPEELKVLEKSAEYKRLKADGVRLMMDPKRDDERVSRVGEEHRPKKYLDIFRTLLTEGSDEQGYFDRLFNRGARRRKLIAL